MKKRDPIVKKGHVYSLSIVDKKYGDMHFIYHARNEGDDAIFVIGRGAFTSMPLECYNALGRPERLQISQVKERFPELFSATVTRAGKYITLAEFEGKKSWRDFKLLPAGEGDSFYLFNLFFSTTRKEHDDVMVISKWLISLHYGELDGSTDVWLSDVMDVYRAPHVKKMENDLMRKVFESFPFD